MALRQIRIPASDNWLNLISSLFSSLPEDGDLIALTLPAPSRAPLSLRLPDDEAAWVWVPGDTAVGMRNEFSTVGRGCAVCLTADGPERFESIRTQADALFSTTIQMIPDTRESAPPVRLAGGGAFSTTDADMWAGFPAAAFLIPRWQYAVSNGQAFFQVVMRRTEWFAITDWPAEVVAWKSWLENPETTVNDVSQTERTEDVTAWTSLVYRALSAIERRELEKVVIAGFRDVGFAAPVSVQRILSRHDNGFAECAGFAIRFTAGDSFVGVTPERLVTVCEGGTLLETDVLAGTVPRSAADEAATEVEQLMASYKNRLEFEYVLHDLMNRIAALGVSVSDHMPMSVKSLSDLHHIHIRLKGIAQQPVHVLRAVSCLHPTPAVCGTPRKSAALWLLEHENLQRGWYAGPIGWFDFSGEGDFAVAIRSARLQNRTGRVYAGCGIVNGSNPLSELAEIRVKQRAMLRAMGVMT